MVIELLKSHVSVRKYKDIPLSQKQVLDIVSAGQAAASSHFVQTYSVIHVTDEEKKKKLADLAKNPLQINGAGAVFVICMDYARLKKAASLLGRDIEFSLAENTIVGVTDAGLFAQNMVVAAESMGFGICYIGGVRNAPYEISELLELPYGVVPLYGLTIGVPDESNEVKPRLPVEAVIHENAYNKKKYEELIPQYDIQLKAYYQSRETNQKDTDWSESMTRFLENPRRENLGKFMSERGYKHR
ncbi:oxygen-insensitive NADPH nitroreductase [Sporosarcina sp. P19]|uniref:oxygen-insensitive NADPH nitroreductase n=1 Tax=Sporosarcina sp. P19 TaxID=2048258 RepID=UPI000C16A7E3|nr:oxygen-insensitive NADPH nitroreductase [Sporosarcina sp. P19]PIC78033.1 oxygen-insensitive NADPH nitroreductase [Sporosarcina sp. P19]